MSRPTLAIVVTALVVASAAGCARPGVERYRVAGAVTCAGKPVVGGEVLFTPDGRGGNRGPQGVATIRKGRFDTIGSRAPGVGGGATIVRVVGAIDPDGRRLVRHEFTVDLPRCDHEFAIEIPAAAAVDSGPEI